MWRRRDGRGDPRGRTIAVVALALACWCSLLVDPARSPAASAAPASGSWTWPVDGPVVAGFDPPDSPYGAGHRGIDVAVAIGTPVLAPADGTVTFAGPVGGRRYVTIDHGGGVRSTVSFVEGVLVRAGETVRAGQPVAASGSGHASGSVPHVHFGVRIGDAYVDPLAYLGPVSVSGFVRLAPCCSMP